MMKVISFLFIFSLTLNAQDWPHFRGPHYNGTSQANDLPVKFSPKQNVKWQTSLPGPSGSTPILYKGKLFISSYNMKKRRLVSLCYDAENGTLLWENELSLAKFSDERSREWYSSAPTPVINDEYVAFSYSNGDVYCFDHSGKKIWNTNLQKKYGQFVFDFSFSSSPLLMGENLIFQILHRKDNFLCCLNIKNGEEMWKVKRVTQDEAESLISYTSPIPFITEKEQAFLSLGAGRLTAHSPQTGKLLWEIDTLNPKRKKNYRMIASVSTYKDLIFCPEPQHGPFHAYKITNGKFSEVWKFSSPTPDVATPAIYQEKVFLLAGRKRVLTCLDIHTGKTLWRGKLPVNDQIRTSPTIADGKLFCMSNSGEVLVLGTGDKFELLSKNEFNEYPSRSTIVAAGKNLYIRTASKLFCISK